MNNTQLNETETLSNIASVMGRKRNDKYIFEVTIPHIYETGIPMKDQIGFQSGMDTVVIKEVNNVYLLEVVYCNDLYMAEYNISDDLFAVLNERYQLMLSYMKK